MLSFFFGLEYLELPRNTSADTRAVCEAALPLSFVSLKILHVSLN